MQTVPWWREPSRGQWLSFLAAWLGWVLDAFDFTIYLLVIPSITRDFGVSMTAAAGSMTLTLLVRFLGGFAAGALGDRYGRKLPLMLSILWFAACDAAIFFAPDFAFVLLFRTLFGFGMGAEWTAGATLAMENWPERSRGIVSGVLQGSWAVGFALAAVVTGFVEPRWGWRPLFLIAALPALLVIPIRLWVPESPEWKRARERKPVPLREVLRTANVLPRILWASSVLGAGFGTYYAVTGLYAPLLQNELGLGASTKSNLVLLFNAGFLVGAVVWGTYAVRKGARRAILVPAAASLLILPSYVGWAPGLAVAAFLTGALAVGHSGVTPLLLAQLFPPEIRARCIGLTYHLGALVAAVAPTVVAALHDGQGLRLSSAMLIVVFVCQGLLLVALVAVPRAAEVAARSAPST